MPTYRGTADRPDQAKAIAGVVAVHVALAFLILSGLNVSTVERAVETLKTFTIPKPLPPPERPPPAQKSSVRQEVTKLASTPKKRSEPMPVAAPVANTPMPSPLPATSIAGSGSALNAGGSTQGGAGGAATGSGAGRGGAVDYSRFTPAQLIQNLSRSDYRTIAKGRLPRGRAMLSLRVEQSGIPTHCDVVRSSGDRVVDEGLCPLIEARLRFRPALDDEGRPIPYQLQYVATWSL